MIENCINKIFYKNKECLEYSILIKRFPKYLTNINLKISIILHILISIRIII